MRHTAHPVSLVLGLLLLCLPAPPIQAQFTLPPDGCQWGTAVAEFGPAKMNARLKNTGAHSQDRNGPFLQVIERDTAWAVGSHALWLGGKVGGDVRQVVSQYGPYELYPGPLDAQGRPPTDCLPYDRIYDVDIRALRAMERGHPPTRDILDWPWQQGAEVVDGDGDPTNYNLEGGDRPMLHGDRTLFWVMNDAANTHNYSGTEPIGMEVRTYAFHSDHPSEVLERTVFFRTQLTYRGNEPLEEAYVGLWFDALWLNWSNDYTGVDTTLDMAFVYDDNDRDAAAWGAPPPALGIHLLEGAKVMEGGVTRDLGMTNFMEIRDVDDGPNYNSLDAYYFMQTRWRDGRSVVEFNLGWPQPGVNPTRYMFAGDPVEGAFWSMENIDGQGVRYYGSSDRRLVLSSGPFRMDPGTTQEILYAITWAQGEDRLDSITALRRYARVIRDVSTAFMDPDYGPRAYLEEEPASPDPPDAFGLAHAFPNPFDERTYIRYLLPRQSSVLLEVFDMLGRRRAILVNGVVEAGEHEIVLEGTDLPSGVYVYRMTIDGRASQSYSVTRFL